MVVGELSATTVAAPGLRYRGQGLSSVMVLGKSSRPAAALRGRGGVEAGWAGAAWVR